MGMWFKLEKAIGISKTIYSSVRSSSNLGKVFNKLVNMESKNKSDYHVTCKMVVKIN